MNRRVFQKRAMSGVRLPPRLDDAREYRTFADKIAVRGKSTDGPQRHRDMEKNSRKLRVSGLVG
jgi:hypothetical protein